MVGFAQKSLRRDGGKCVGIAVGPEAEIEAVVKEHLSELGFAAKSVDDPRL